MTVTVQGAKATGENWRDNWQTPVNVLELVTLFYGDYWFDPCPVDPDINGLEECWSQYGNSQFINPPFSQYAKWIDFGLRQGCDKNRICNNNQGCEQIWLCNSNTDTKYYHKLLNASSALVLTNYRMSFRHPETGEEINGNRQGQTLFYIGSRPREFGEVFGELGTVLQGSNRA